MAMILAAAFPPASPTTRGRRKPSTGLLVGVGVSALLHVAAGVYLYQQRFELDLPVTVSNPMPNIVTLVRPEPIVEPEPPEVVRTTVPPIVVREPATPFEQTQVTPLPRTPDIVVPDLTGIPTFDPPLLPDVGVEVTPTMETPPAPAVIRDPTWERLPTAAELADAYPERAIENEVTGRVVMRCTVAANGSVSGCGVVEESPRGYRFGQAALRLQSRFRMSPRTRDGEPVGGASVSIPLSFTLN